MTLTATASVGALTDSQSASGTVDGGYRVVEEPFSWVDATVGGTRLTLADDAQATVALPFSFRYYGQPFTSVAVSSNGFLVLGRPSDRLGQQPAPQHRHPQRRHRRLLGRPQPRPRRRLWYRNLGTAPNRKLVISLGRRPPRRHRRPDQLPGNPGRGHQRHPGRLPRHPARKSRPRPRRLRHRRDRITRRHPGQPIPLQPASPRPLQATTASDTRIAPPRHRTRRRPQPHAG